MRLAGLVLAALLARPAAACRCDAELVKSLLAHPETAATAALGRVETVDGRVLFRVENAWTEFASVVGLGDEKKCALTAAPGKRVLLLSTIGMKEFKKYRKPTICDSALIAPTEKAVGALSGKFAASALGGNPSWGWCRRDGDCALTPGVCGGQDAVAKKSLADHDAWRRETAPRVNCIAAAPVAGAKAVCVENFCAVR